MKILCDTGLVKGRKAGKWMHYSISREGAETTRQLLDAILPADPVCCQDSPSSEYYKTDCC